MRGLLRAFTLVGCLILVPTLAHAQATLAGVVRDSSDAVLPGVTVEAASPTLIEKVRSAVTDGSGQYPHHRASARYLYAHSHAHWIQHREA